MDVFHVMNSVMRIQAPTGVGLAGISADSPQPLPLTLLVAATVTLLLLTGRHLVAATVRNQKAL